jgi:hypothetical protein
MTTDQRRVEGKETAMRGTAIILLVTAVAIMALAMACGGGDKEESTPSPEATTAPTTAPTPTEAGGVEISDIAVDAAQATITVDGHDSDWDSIEGATIPLKQIDLDELDPIQVQDLEIDFGELPPVDATLKVATDEENVYVLLEVPDGFDYNPDPAMHNFSASIAVMFRIDDSAPAHMGVEEKDLDASLGVVDIWHWELDCGPGEMSGGGTEGGDDPECNFDDEYAPNPEDREDDGGGDTPNNPTGENSLSGVWTHTAAEAGGEGTWIFEMSRPLQTGDTQDVQFASGENAYLALAYFDPSETPEGWTDAGHLQSADIGWLEVALP